MSVARLILILAGALVILIGGVVAADYVAYGEVVHPGVDVWGVEAGGLARSALEQELEERSKEILGRPLRIAGEDGEIEIVPRAAGVSLNTSETAKEAWSIGRTGPLWSDVVARASAWRSQNYIAPLLVVDQTLWREATDRVALEFEQVALDAHLEFRDGAPKAVADRVGVALDRNALRSLVLEAVQEGRGRIEAPLRRLEPTVTTEDAQEALRAARTMLALPITLTYQGESFTLSPEELADISSIRPRGVETGLPLTFASDAARDLLGERLAPIIKAPENARIIPDPGGKGYTVQPSYEGTVVEWDTLFRTLDQVAIRHDRRVVPIPTTTRVPDLTTRDAEQLQTRREISSFTTYFSPTDHARVQNIRQVARILHQTVIRPGETFSFNETVGPRTKAAGFDEAPVIRGGVLTPGVGGGICQVSTTLFNAVFVAGLPIVERHPHSFFIDHYPIGRDAMVSYGTADLRFRNDSEQILLLSVSTGDRSVRASLAAPQWNRTVEYDTGEIHDIVPPQSSEDHPRRLRDPNLRSGEESELEKGVAGRSVKVTRRVFTNDGTQLSAGTFRSTYGPKDYIIRVGG